MDDGRTGVGGNGGGGGDCGGELLVSRLPAALLANKKTTDIKLTTGSAMILFIANKVYKQGLVIIGLSLLLLACTQADTPPKKTNTISTMSAQSSDGYSEVIKGKTLQFPQDHSAHNDFKIEFHECLLHIKRKNFQLL